MSTNPYLAHIVGRIQDDIEFLVSQGALSHSDACFITDRLSAAKATAPSMPTPITSPASLSIPSAPSAKRWVPPPPRGSAQPQAKALWAYNENGQVCCH